MLLIKPEVLNPGQMFIMMVDAPLFALAVYVQWNWPRTHGKNIFVIMFGRLHLKIAMWNTFGDCLEEARTAFPGTATLFFVAPISPEQE